MFYLPREKLKNWIFFQNLAKANVLDDFRILSENHDKNNVKFISTVEHVRMPFYAVQFHPEKNMFEWIKGKNIPHSPNSIKANQYFADFFVNEGKFREIFNTSPLLYFKLKVYNSCKIFYTQLEKVCTTSSTKMKKTSCWSTTSRRLSRDWRDLHSSKVISSNRLGFDGM